MAVTQATDLADFSSGIGTAGAILEVDNTNNRIGIGTTNPSVLLDVDGDVRITGILTVGSSSLTLDGTNNVVNVGTALTLGHTQGIQFHTQNLHATGFEVNNINASGIITASSADFNGNVSIAGTLTYEDVTNIDSVGLITARSGIHIDDSIVHIGDTDTKIRFPADDTITAETGGTEKLRITSSGLIDISGGVQVSENITPTSGAGLELFREGGGGGQVQAYDRGNTTWLPLIVKGSTQSFYTSGTERLRINSGGDVGIGTTNPSAKLEVYNGKIRGGTANSTNGSTLIENRYSGINILNILGSMHSTGGTALTYGLRPKDGSQGFDSSFSNFSGGRVAVVLQGSGLRIQTAASQNTTVGDTVSVTNRVIVDLDGNIGIGTDTPNSYPGYTTLTLNASNGGEVDFESNGTIRGQIYASSTRFNVDALGSSIPLAFKVNDAERMRITSDGDVSISTTGTVHGVSKLTLLPADRTSAFDASNGDTWHDVVLMQNDNAADNAVGIAFEVGNSGSYHKNAGTGIAAVKNGTNSDYGADLVFITRPQSAVAQERLRITSNGKVGIGTDNPGAALQIHKDAAGNLPLLQTKSHVSAAGNFTNNYSVEIRHATSTVTHGMLISNKETDDARRTLDVADGNGVFATFTNGKVGIGSEIPSKTLDVSGTGTFSGSLRANPLSLTSSESWIRSGYGAISNSSVLSLNNLLIGQNMRGYMSGLDGGSSNNNFYHVVTHAGMGYNGIEFCYSGTMKFYTNSGASTANNTFTPSERLRIKSNGDVLMGGVGGNNYTGTSWGSGIPTFEFKGTSSSQPTRSGFIGFDSYSGTQGYAGIWSDNGSLQFYTGLTRTGDGAATEKLHITSGGQLQATGAADVRLTLGSGGTAGTNDSVHVRADGANLLFMNANTGITKFESNGTETLRISSGGHMTSGNLTISGYLANSNSTVGGYGQVQCDNHANTFFGQNIKLSASSGNGNHQLEIINQHSSIGGAGMWIGGNGNSYNNQINFYAVPANQTAGTRVDQSSRMKIDPLGVTVNRIGAPQAQLDVNQASGHPAFNIGFSDGSFYRNLGTAGPYATDSSTGAYLHIRLRTVWNDASMTMFRVTGYYPYSVYCESYIGMYRYNNSNYRNNPYGQVIVNQGNSSLVHSVYNTGVDPGYLVIVCYWNTTYTGVMIEHCGAGSVFGSYMQTDLEIIDSKRSAATTDQWPA